MKQAIVFAFYKGDKLIGFRTDTVGTIGLEPKIYYYSKDQVATVLENIFSNCEEARKSFPDEVADAAEVAATQGGIAVMLSRVYSRTAKAVRELGEFEVRILPCPGYVGLNEKGDNLFECKYPTEELLEWLQKPMPQPLEVHKFKV